MADFTDIVVLIPGITGSVLERNGREVWGASAAAVLHGLMSGGRSIQDLILENDDPAVDDLGDGVRATRLVDDVHLFPGLWTIDGYTKVAQRLCQRLKLEPGVSYFTLPYDWRRDNRVAARKLQRESAGWLAARRRKFPDARMVLVAHSMGGLVSRYFLEVLGGWRDVRTLVSFGTPYRGSLNAVDTIINGARKLNILDLTDLSRSFTAIYQLLPTYRCFDNGDGTLVKLSDVNDLPRLDRSHIDRIRAADAFHREIEKAVAANQAEAGASVVRYAIRPVVGMEQPTQQTAVRAADGVTLGTGAKWRRRRRRWHGSPRLGYAVRGGRSAGDLRGGAARLPAEHGRGPVARAGRPDHATRSRTVASGRSANDALTRR